jgi:hypothetical protein
MTTQWVSTAQNILDCLSELKNYPDKTLAPYEEFEVGGKSYYFTPGGSLYRKDSPERAPGIFCGYLTEEALHFRTDEG